MFSMSTHSPEFNPGDIPACARVAIAAARFNGHIVDELIVGCMRRLTEIGPVAFEMHRVPGAFELPLAAKLLGKTGRFAAVICLGAVVRGDTPHFEYVAGECARGVQLVAIELSLPVIFGVLTTNTEQQALDRIGGAHGHAGERAAEAAVEMIVLGNRLSRP
jgi:6,7-dimethyl-8-ribityllumazine synthase